MHLSTWAWRAISVSFIYLAPTAMADRCATATAAAIPVFETTAHGPTACPNHALLLSSGDKHVLSSAWASHVASASGISLLQYAGRKSCVFCLVKKKYKRIYVRGLPFSTYALRGRGVSKILPIVAYNKTDRLREMRMRGREGV